MAGKGKRGAPPKYPEVEVFAHKIAEYFEACDSKGDPYTVSGLCLALNLTREGLRSYGEKPEFADTVKKAKLQIENHLESGILKGKYNPTAGIFNLKNNFGWKDKTEHEVTGKDGGPIKTVDLSHLSVDELKTLESVLSRATPEPSASPEGTGGT